MYPVLFGEDIWALPSYFAMLMLGFFVGVILLQRQAMAAGWDGAKIIDLSLILIVASIVGARVFHVLFDGFFMEYIALCSDPASLAKTLPSGAACTSDAQCLAAQNSGVDIGALCHAGQCQPEKDCFRALKFWSGGLTYYGGFIFAVISAYIVARRKGWSFLTLSDFAAPSIALGLGFGRIGCFLAGCCFGARSELPWAMHFPQYSDAWRYHAEHYPEELAAHAKHGIMESLAVHPTQLYESFGSFAIFAFLWFYLRKRKRYEGDAIAFLLISYAVLRFSIEFVRADARGGYILSTSQWISLPLLALGIFIMWHARKQKTL
ncbi:MAG: prolipoprotein diacylglyceryl transferase [Bradymonadales bacterium]|jgi:phosphatidylglycerol:prolipoprotein diacylglycerol transferase